MLKTDFSTEGKPDGWQRVERIRISPWRGDGVDTAVTMHSLYADLDHVALVEGTRSTQNPAERNAAKRTTKRISGWLRELDIPHGAITDEDVIEGALSGTRVAILSYNPNLPAAELSALRKYVREGGRLIVFYSSDAGLAKLLGMKLGGYTKTDDPGRWNAFSFVNPNAWHVPKTIYQKSWNIRPVYPARKDAEVIAYWESAKGKRSRDPAWIASDDGAWMTHVLLDDDVSNKKRMLLGLIGAYDPTMWPSVARHVLNTAGKVGSFKSFNETISHLTRQAEYSGAARRVHKLLDAAQSRYSGMLSLYESGNRYAQVIEEGELLRKDLVTAYGLVQRSAIDEFRGVWDHDGMGWYPGNWRKTCSILADEGINAIFPNMLTAGTAHYPSKILPSSFTYRRYGDQIEQCVDAAHREGIKVHVWKVCWSLQGAPKEMIESLKKQRRLQVRANGEVIPWLSPSVPQNITAEIEALKDIVRRYDVDGIHLDYIRYPDSGTCFSDISRASFERWVGRKVRKWPDDVRDGGSLVKEYRQWRADQISRFVARASREIKSIRPSVQLSAAVYGKYPQCIPSVAQDWVRWLKEGTVDFVCPMNYTTFVDNFRDLTHAQLRQSGTPGRVFPGLGVTATESQLDPDEAIEQIAVLREAGARGFMLFDLSNTLREDTLPILSLGMTKSTD